MAFAKSNLYDPGDQKIAFIARVMGHPARLQILRQLIEHGPASVEEIGKLHPIAQPTLSRHISQLRKSSLIQFEERYPCTYYYVDYGALMKARNALAIFFKKLLDSGELELEDGCIGSPPGNGNGQGN